MIVVRLYGEKIDRAEVFAGMSGSPVYINDKLAGSVSFQLGTFPKERIAGMTPAQYIVDTAIPYPEVKGADTTDFLSNFESSVLSKAKINDSMLQSILPKIFEATETMKFAGSIYNKIQFPFYTSGVNSVAISSLGGLLAGSNFQIINSKTGNSTGLKYHINSASDIVDSVLASKPFIPKPGGVIYIPLVRGDISIGASGTVTHIDGDKFFAFGHEFYRFGIVEWPIHRGKVLTVFPSTYSSFHIVEPAEEIGCMTGDMIAGINGTLGKKASMIPIEIYMRNKGSLIKKYNVESVQGRLAPMILWVVNQSVIANTIDTGREATVNVSFIIQLEGDYDPVVVDDIYNGLDAVQQSTLLPAAALYFLETNEFEKIKVKNIKVSFDYHFQPLLAEITKIRYDKEEVAPGDKVKFNIYLKTWRGQTVMKSMDLRIPKTFPEGKVKIIVGDAATVTKAENSNIGKTPRFTGLKQIIRLISSIRASNIIYVQTFRLSDGVYQYGKFLSDLPATAYEVLTAKQTDGEIIPLNLSLLAEDRIETDYFIAGHQAVIINIKKKPVMEEK
jgi:hypothetical protein